MFRTSNVITLKSDPSMQEPDILSVKSHRCYNCVSLARGCSVSRTNKPFFIQYDFKNHRHRIITGKDQQSAVPWIASPELRCRCGNVWPAPSSANDPNNTTDPSSDNSDPPPLTFREAIENTDQEYVVKRDGQHAPSSQAESETIDSMQKVLDVELEEGDMVVIETTPLRVSMSDDMVLSVANSWIGQAVVRMKKERWYKDHFDTFDVPLFDISDVSSWIGRWAVLMGKDFYGYDNQFGLARPIPSREDWQNVWKRVILWSTRPWEKQDDPSGQHTQSWRPIDYVEQPKRNIRSQVEVNDNGIQKTLSDPFGGLHVGVTTGYFQCLRAITADIDRTQDLPYDRDNPNLTIFMAHPLTYKRSPKREWDEQDAFCMRALSDGQNAFAAQLVLPATHPASVSLGTADIKLSHVSCIVWSISIPGHRIAVTIHITSKHVYAYAYESSNQTDYRQVLTKVR